MREVSSSRKVLAHTRRRNRTRIKPTRFHGMDVAVARFSKEMDFTLVLPLVVFLVSSIGIADRNPISIFCSVMDIHASISGEHQIHSYPITVTHDIRTTIVEDDLSNGISYVLDTEVPTIGVRYHSTLRRYADI